MHRRLQFGMRENPASNRRHGSRQAVSSAAKENSIKEQNLALLGPLANHNPPFLGVRIAPHATSPHAATGAGYRDDGRLMNVHEVAELLQVPVSWVYERTRRRGLEQLPHLKIGKYLRFEESALAEFIRRQSRA
jgi:excisionase family DNA binding protein